MLCNYMHVLYTPKFIQKSLIQNEKDIILGGRELHIKIIQGASLSPVRKQVTWGCQCAAAMGLSVLLPWVQPFGVSARFICVPGCPAGQGQASVLFVCAEQGEMARPHQALERSQNTFPLEPRVPQSQTGTAKDSHKG